MIDSEELKRVLFAIRERTTLEQIRCGLELAIDEVNRLAEMEITPADRQGFEPFEYTERS